MSDIPLLGGADGEIHAPRKIRAPWEKVSKKILKRRGLGLPWLLVANLAMAERVRAQEGVWGIMPRVFVRETGLPLLTIQWLLGNGVLRAARVAQEKADIPEVLRDEQREEEGDPYVLRVDPHIGAMLRPLLGHIEATVEWAKSLDAAHEALAPTPRQEAPPLNPHEEPGAARAEHYLQ